MFKLQKH